METLNNKIDFAVIVIRQPCQPQWRPAEWKSSARHF